MLMLAILDEKRGRMLARSSSVLDTEQRGHVNVSNEKGIKK